MRARGWIALVAALAAGGCLERGGDSPRREPEPAPRTPAPLLVDALEPAGRPDPDATIRVRLEAEPAHLNPLLAGDAIAERLLLGDVYEGLLCAPQPDARAEPCLAESVEVDDGGRCWRFALRDGVVWHDGEALSAGDVVFTFELVRRAPTTLGADLADLESVESTGDVVELCFGSVRADRRQVFARVPIVPAHRFRGVPVATLATAPVSAAPIGTGPLRVVGWERGERIVLERWERYWGEPARAARVEHVVRPGRARAAAELAAGRLDLALQLPVDEALIAAVHPDLVAFSHSQPAYLAAVFNTRKGALASPAARRALVATLDREALSRELFGGRAPVITGPFLPGDGDASIEPIAFDVDAARAVLAEDGAPPALEVAVPAGSRTTARIADIWAADARPAAALEVTPVPYATLLERLRRGDFDVALMSFTTGPEVDVWPLFHGSQVGAGNVAGVRDALLDRALDDARTALTPEARRDARRRVHRRLRELAPFAFLVGDVRVGVARTDIGGAGDGAAEWGARSLWRAR